MQNFETAIALALDSIKSVDGKHEYFSVENVGKTITKVTGSKYRLGIGYRFKIFIKKHNQSGTYGIELLSNLQLTRPARNSMNLECSSHDSILKYVFVVMISCASRICRTCYREHPKIASDNIYFQFNFPIIWIKKIVYIFFLHSSEYLRLPKLIIS